MPSMYQLSQMASSLRFIAYTNVKQSVSSRDYVVPPKGLLKYPRERASGLGGLIPDLPFTMRYDSKEHYKISIHKGGAKYANVTLVLSVQTAMSVCMLNKGLVALKSTTQHQ